jgi:hypothetical protein
VSVSLYVCFPRYRPGPRSAERKKFFYSNEEKLIGEPTCLPNSPDMQAHTAKVLQQVEGTSVRRGGWVGGDAWFGSVMTAVEVKKAGCTFHDDHQGTHPSVPHESSPCDLTSTARHGTRPAVHWLL